MSVRNRNELTAAKVRMLFQDLGLGSALATIGLTIPAVAALSVAASANFGPTRRRRPGAGGEPGLWNERPKNRSFIKVEA